MLEEKSGDHLINWESVLFRRVFHWINENQSKVIRIQALGNVVIYATNIFQSGPKSRSNWATYRQAIQRIMLQLGDYIWIWTFPTTFKQMFEFQIENNNPNLHHYNTADRHVFAQAPQPLSK